MGIETLSQVATALGAPLAVLALAYTGIQLKRTLAVERGRFLLELERMSATHDKTHLRLRPGGDLSDGRSTPQTAAEWSELEDYMGFFEHCELLIQAESLELDRFKRLFGYRVGNIVANKSIVDAKLVQEGRNWQDFRSLAERLGYQLPPAK